MKLTVELKADQIADLAHLAEMLDITRRNDTASMRSVYPLHVIMAMNSLLESFSDLLVEMDSPFEIGDDVTKDASILAYRLKEIGESMLEMKADFEERKARK